MANKISPPYDALKEEHEMYSDITTFSHSLLIKIPVIDKKDGNGNTSNIPKQLSLAFKKILSTNKNTTIETCIKQMIGSTKDILVENEQFDK